MTWNHRSGGGWQSPTIKRRQGGEWVTIGISGGSGGGPTDSPSGWVNTDYLLTGDPPTRSNTIYVSDYNSIEAAVNDAPEDTRIVIDYDTYSESDIDIPFTDHLTIDGTGVELTRSDASANLFESNRHGGEFSTNTDASGTYSPGQTSIDVADGSLFSSGDIIRIYDPDQEHPGMFENTGTNSGQGVYHVVESVSGDTITLDEQVFFDWDDPSGNLRVDNVDFGSRDLRITNMTIDGNDPERDQNIINEFRVFHELWMDNVSMRDGSRGLWLYESYQARLDNVTFDNMGNNAENYYPLDITNGTHHTLMTNCESYNSGRYGFKSGSGGSWWPCRNGRYVNCYAQDANEPGFDQHPGSAFFEYIDCSTQGCAFGRPRGIGWYSEGGGTDTSNHWSLATARASGRDWHFTEHHFTNHSGDNVIYNRDRGGVDSGFLTVEDVWVETTNSLGTFFEFAADSGLNATMGELTIDHVAIDNEWLTSGNIDSYIDADSNFTIDSISVTNPSDGTTPSEYFDNEFGW